MLSYFLTDWQRTAKGVAMGVFCPEIIFLKMYHVLYNFIVNTPQNDSRWLWIHQTMHLHVRLPLRQLTALPNHCNHPQKKFLTIKPREEPNINVISMGDASSFEAFIMNGMRQSHRNHCRESMVWKKVSQIIHHHHHHHHHHCHVPTSCSDHYVYCPLN